MEVTKNSFHDCLMLPPLLDQIPGRVRQVSADGVPTIPGHATKLPMEGALRMASIKQLHPGESGEEYLLTIQGGIWWTPPHSRAL